MRILVRVLLLVTIVLAFAFHLFQSGTGAQALDPNGIPTCTPPPPGMVGWWPAEGTANDIRGDNNGALNGNGFFAGEVEQAFSFSNVSGITVPDSPVLNPQTLTIDAWVT